MASCKPVLGDKQLKNRLFVMQTPGLYMMVIVSLLYVGVRLSLFTGTAPILYPDSNGYLDAPFQMRPFTVPLIYGLLRDRPEYIMLFQIYFATVSWLSLAWTLFFLARNRVARILGPGLVLAFSLSNVIVQWDATILSESLSFSLFVDLITVSMWLFVRLRRKKLVDRVIWLATLFLWLPLLVLFLNTRDTNVYMIPFGIILVLAVTWRARGGAKLAAFLCISMLGAFFWQQGDADAKQRWVFPLVDVILQRILPDPQSTLFFSERGMPIDKGIMNQAGHWPLDNDAYLLTRTDFLRWVRTQGRTTYISYLMSRPIESQKVILRDMEHVLDPAPIRGYGPNGQFHGGRGYMGAVPLACDNLFFFRVSHPKGWLLFLIGLPSVMLAFDRKSSRRWLHTFTLFMFLVFWSQLFIAYHGDAMEINRHTLFANSLFRLSFFLTLYDGYVFTKTIREARQQMASRKV